MAVFKSINDAIDSVERAVPKAVEKGRLLVATQFAQDAKQDFIAFESGDLGDSGIKTPRSLLDIGVVRWRMPYAELRYDVNYKTPSSLQWDVKTWDKNINNYEQQMAKAIEEGAI